MTCFFNDILHGLVALYGRDGFKATSFDVHSHHSFYLYEKIEVAPPRIDFSLHLDKISIQ